MTRSSASKEVSFRSAAKVPAVGAVFWAIKLLTTGVGEAAGDYLARLSVPLAACVGSLLLVTTLWWQFRSTRYAAWPYWSAVLGVAVFGTMAADGLHIVLGVPYVASSAFFALAAAVVFYCWWRVEGTLSIHSITSPRREAFYWLTVLVTFALGTAVGDFTAASLGIGYLFSAVLFAGLMCVPALGWWRFGLNPVIGFWFAYVLTRPLGASIADWLGKSYAGGLGFGDGPVTLIGLALFAVLVAIMAMTKYDVQTAEVER